MRILHVSDLHIGAHNENLLKGLETRVGVLKPDVIVGTGDFADAPSRAWLTSARGYMDGLARLCAERDDGPVLIAVPGNHDVAHFKGTFGIFGSAGNYNEIFNGLPTTGFYPAEGVWIYGFDSAREDGVGANGNVLQSDLTAFDQAFEDAKARYKQDFERAYKIVALHHHPLPIRFSAKYSRWVTLLNASEFLDEMLNHDIDLVIHGHEHVHAQAAFGKRFNGRDRSLTVVSVGTAFHKDAGDDHNRFNLICIEPDGAVHIESYEAKGGTYGSEPIDRYVARSTAESDSRQFREMVAERGYSYRSVIARAVINQDGDVERSAEFHGLVIDNAKVERARIHRISLPQTSGYIDVPTAWEITAGDKSKRLVFKRIDKSPGDQRIVGSIEYGRTLQPGVPFSLRCQWWAVNAMAMSVGQSSKKYQEPQYEEYTHFPILDPVGQLMCMVDFPPGFELHGRPEPFVAKVDDRPNVGLVVAERDAAMEDKLRSSVVVDDSVKAGKRATMQIPTPTVGYTYGFRWSLPDEVEGDGSAGHGETADIVDALLHFRTSKDADQRNKLVSTLGSAGELVREKFAAKFKGPLEFGLMVFDADARKMVSVGAVRRTKDQFEWIEQEHMAFQYGEGVGGIAFKTKAARVYSRVEGGSGKATPDYYREFEDGSKFAVLLALPISHPDSDQNVYAVLSCGSTLKSCPLRDLGSNGLPVSREDVKTAQVTVNKALYEALTDIFLNGA